MRNIYTQLNIYKPYQTYTIPLTLYTILYYTILYYTYMYIIYVYIQVLNKFSNVAYRTVLYGRKFEKNIVIADIENTIPIYANKYTNNNIYSQEILFLKLLLVLLRDGLSAAENVVLNKVYKSVCICICIYSISYVV